MRRMIVTGVRASGRRVTIAGPRRQAARAAAAADRGPPPRLVQPLARGPADPAEQQRPVPVTLAGPPSRLAATYRLATRVRASARGNSRKTFETFTLPRFVDLG